VRVIVSMPSERKSHSSIHAKTHIYCSRTCMLHILCLEHRLLTLRAARSIACCPDAEIEGRGPLYHVSAMNRIHRVYH
jgi:hypothetical protein